MPNACETKMVMTMNCRSLNNFFNLRCCNRAQWRSAPLPMKCCALYTRLRRMFLPQLSPLSGGPCPEGGMCCGKQNAVRDKYATLKQEAENHG